MYVVFVQHDNVSALPTALITWILHFVQNDKWGSGWKNFIFFLTKMGVRGGIVDTKIRIVTTIFALFYVFIYTRIFFQKKVKKYLH